MRHVGLRNWPLLDVGERLTGGAIKKKQSATLGGRDQRADLCCLSFGNEIDEHRLRRYIVVPDIVMRRLERPTERSALGIERDDRAGESFRLRRAMTAVVIGRGIASWDVDEAELVIGAEHAPRIRGTARECFFRLQLGDGFSAPDIPGPQHAAAERIEPADYARRLLYLDVVGDPAAEHGDATRHGRR